MPVHDRPVKCFNCGAYCRPDIATCPECGAALGGELATTVILERREITFPEKHQRQTEFLAEANAILKISPSGACISLPVDNVVMLGRSMGLTSRNFLDLSEFGAQDQGVSRHHCQLQRRGNTLIVTDLGSTNGTYLNDEQLSPRQDCVLAHGDDLLLGRLHLVVLFSTCHSS
jgi:pSer/pThr/pTyr-binding forkhead associated (FHA) protein